MDGSKIENLPWSFLKTEIQVEGWEKTDQTQLPLTRHWLHQADQAMAR